MFHWLTKKTISPYLAWPLLMAVVILVVPNFASANGPLDIIAAMLLSVINTVFGWMVGATGFLLNIAINEYVVGFGKAYVTSGIGVAVESIWVIIRDVFNLTFIFGLVYIGLKMIFNSEDTSAKKMLVSLIIAALFVNFSLFISKTVVEASNLVAAQIVTGFEKDNTGKYNITEAFAHKMGLQSTFSYNMAAMGKLDSGGVIGYVIGLMIMYIVTSFVFFAGAILLIIRYVALNLYIIFSPLMFAGMVFPALQSTSSAYWKGFLGKAFFAPAYLLLLYISYRILSGSSPNGTPFASLFNGAPDTTTFTAVLIPFIITCILLMYSVTLAQKMGATGAGTLISGGNTARRWAQGKVTGIAGRSTIGRLGDQTTSIGRGAARLNANLNTRLAQSRTLRFAASAVGLSARNRQEALDGAGNARFGSSYSRRDDVQFDRQQRVRDNRVIRSQTQTQAADTNLALLENNNTSLAGLGTAMEVLGNNIRDMNAEDRASYVSEQMRNNPASMPHVAAHLTDAHITAFEGSGMFTDTEIGTMRGNRTAARTNIAQHGSATALPANSPLAGVNGAVVRTADQQAYLDQVYTQTLFRGGLANVEGLPPAVFAQAHVYEHISPQMLERRLAAGGITNAEIAGITNALSTYLATAPQAEIQAWAGAVANRPVLGRLPGLIIPQVVPAANNPPAQGGAAPAGNNPPAQGGAAPAGNNPPPPGYQPNGGGILLPNNPGNGPRVP